MLPHYGMAILSFQREEPVQGLSRYREYSEQRLGELRSEIKNIGLLDSQLKNLAVYVCGSYGRLEAHPQSDLDPFFVDTRLDIPERARSWCDHEERVSNIPKTQEVSFFAGFVEAMERLKFPPLTGQGQYLRIHELADIRSTLGGRRDDYENHFTARMLLLLESRSLHDNGAYEELVEKVIGFYFKDYHDHERDFQAVFLLNDIVRYWKTMCLNYEHKRELDRLSDIEDEEEQALRKAKVHLKNLKLKFSRLMICYSMVIPLVAAGTHDPKQIAELVGMTPIERIMSKTRRGDRANEVIERYVEFLNVIAQGDILSQILEKPFRNRQFELARQFRDEVYGLLQENADESTWRYLVI